MIDLQELFLKLSALFRSTYVCEHTIFLIKIVKNKFHSHLTDGQVEATITVAISNIKIDIEELARQKQSHVSH